MMGDDNNKGATRHQGLLTTVGDRWSPQWSRQKQYCCVTSKKGQSQSHAWLGWSSCGCYGKRKLYNRLQCVCAMKSPVVEKRWWWLFIVLVVEVRRTKSCYLRPSTASWRKYFIVILVICCMKYLAPKCKVVSDNSFYGRYVGHDTIKSPHKTRSISKHYNICTWQDCTQEWAQKLFKHA